MDSDDRFQPIKMGLSVRQAGIEIPDGEAQIRPHFRMPPVSYLLLVSNE